MMKNILIIIFVVCLSISGIYAQNVAVQSLSDQDSTRLFVGLKDSLKPDIYIDGTKYDHKILNLLDPEKIASINVLKGEEAVKKYKAHNGVILITTKEANKNNDDVTGIRIRDKSSIDNNSPMVIIDGIVVSREELSKIPTNDVESISVFKGEMAMKKYNAPNGVIVVKTYKSKGDK